MNCHDILHGKITLYIRGTGQKNRCLRIETIIIEKCPVNCKVDLSGLVVFLLCTHDGCHLKKEPYCGKFTLFPSLPGSVVRSAYTSKIYCSRR